MDMPDLEEERPVVESAVSREHHPAPLGIKTRSPPSPQDPTAAFISDTPNSSLFHSITHTLDAMWRSKVDDKDGRNTLQSRQVGGLGEPFYKDPMGFDISIGMTIEHGKRVFVEKWGYRDCNTKTLGFVAEDAWKLEHDWE